MLGCVSQEAKCSRQETESVKRNRLMGRKACATASPAGRAAALFLLAGRRWKNRCRDGWFGGESGKSANGSGGRASSRADWNRFFEWYGHRDSEMANQIKEGEGCLKTRHSGFFRQKRRDARKRVLPAEERGENGGFRKQAGSCNTCSCLFFSCRSIDSSYTRECRRTRERPRNRARTFNLRSRFVPAPWPLGTGC